VLAAVRVARAHTGKPKIVKFYGHYHGQDDQFLVGLEPAPRPFGAGIPGEQKLGQSPRPSLLCRRRSCIGIICSCHVGTHAGPTLTARSGGRPRLLSQPVM
jgi:hypothetical protein